jgi:uncharacterized protein (TIGR03085 family)
MSSIAASERTLLCALAQQLGPGAPTLAGDWTVKDLVVHLLLREGSLAGVGVVVRPLAGVLDRASAKRGGEDLPTLVRKLRHGPPAYSPFAIPKVGSFLNLLEFFVHHEDIRRAQPGWEPRTLPPETEDGIWRSIRMTGRALVAKAGVGVGVVAQRSDTGERAVLRKGEPQVVLRGLPSELTLYLFGRKPQARVVLDGDAAATERLQGARLGL